VKEEQPPVLEAKKGQEEPARVAQGTSQKAMAAGSTVAGRYTLERVLGTGGMGTVWLAHDSSLDSKCALKLVDSEQAKIDEVRVRFEREAKASAQLRGAHVVHVFDYGVWDDVPFIAMELLEGEDLAQRLARVKRLGPAETYWVVAHICRALSKAHALGIVHRDLKPENIFLVDTGGEEIAKVVDFGIAKHERYSVGDRTTKIGSFLGTPHYVSPEQARGQFTDGRSDLWAVGVIAYQCITGRLPFSSESLGSLMGQILYDEIPIPSRLVDAVPPGFDAWWERASRRKPDARFQTAQELSDALAEALEIESRLTVPSLPPRRSFSSIPPIPELRDASGADVSGVRERADLASVVIADNAEDPVPTTPGRASHGADGVAASAGTLDARPASLPVTVLAQRKQLGLGGFKLVTHDLQHHKWLLAAVGVGLIIVMIALMALAGGDEKRSPAAAAQPQEHVVTVKPPPEATESSKQPSIEVTPAEPSIDLVRPEELDVEAAPRPAPQPQAPVAPRAAPPGKPSFKPSRPDYGI
jgi:serine/threonine protein kinase